MDLERLAGMVAKAQDDKGISDYLLEHEIGVLPNRKTFNATQIGRLKQGKRILPIPPEAVYRMIRILGLDPIAASKAAGVWPPGYTEDMIRKLDLVATDAMTHTPGRLRVPADLAELIDRNRRLQLAA